MGGPLDIGPVAVVTSIARVGPDSSGEAVTTGESDIAVDSTATTLSIDRILTAPGFYYGAGYYPYVGSYISPYWSYPSYYPYSYDYSSPAISAGPAVTVLSTGASNQTPSTVIVNNTTPREQTRSEDEDSGLRRPPPEASQSQRQPEPQATRSQIYLIAARNGIVWAALAYWVEGQTLNFVTVKGERKQMPLAQIDRDLSEQFNRERNVPFRLP